MHFIDPSGAIRISMGSINKIGTDLWKGSVKALSSREAQLIYGIVGGATLIAVGTVAGGMGMPQVAAIAYGAGAGMLIGAFGGYIAGNENVFSSAVRGAAFGGAVTAGAVIGGAIVGAVGATSGVAAFGGPL